MLRECVENAEERGRESISKHITKTSLAFLRFCNAHSLLLSKFIFCDEVSEEENARSAMIPTHPTVKNTVIPTATAPNNPYLSIFRFLYA